MRAMRERAVRVETVCLNYLQPVYEDLAFHEVQNYEHVVLVLAVRVHLDAVRVVDHEKRPYLPPDAALQLRKLGRVDHFDRHELLCLPIPGLAHDAECTLIYHL